MKDTFDDYRMNEKSDNALKLIEAYKNPVQLDIIIYLLVFRKLSLTELCHKLKKSKPTISKYTKELVALDIIQEFSEVEFEGRIATKYYTFKTFPETINEKDLIHLKEAQKLQKSLIDTREVEKNSMNMITRFINILENFFVKEEKKISEIAPTQGNLNFLRDIAEKEKPFFQVFLIADKFKEEYNEILEDFRKKMNGLMNKSIGEKEGNLNNLYCELMFNFEQIIE